MLFYQLEQLGRSAATGAEVPLAELRELNLALHNNMVKSAQSASLQKAGIGYPIATPSDSSTVSGGGYAPLVPQSIQPIYDVVTASERHLVLQKLITKTSVTSPVFEYPQLRKWGGSETSIFIAEGGVPAITQSHFTKQVVRMKYMAVHRQLTDVLTQTGLLSGIGNARAQEARAGSMELSMAHERNLLYADSSINPLEFDGIIPSVERFAPENVMDAEGNTITGQEIQSFLAMLVSPPIYGDPQAVLMSARHYTWYQNSLIPFKRGDLASDQGLTLSTTGISVGSHLNPKVPFTVVPLLEPIHHPITRVEGHAPPVALTPVLSVIAGGTTSKWRSADVLGRDFYYTFIMQGDNGVTRTINVGPVRLVAGESVQGDFADSAVTESGPQSIRSYAVFRASIPTPTNPADSVAPTDPSSYFRVSRYGRNTLGGGGGTKFVDHNLTRPNTAPIIIFDNRSDVMEWKEFLPVTQRPVSLSLSTTEQFLLTMFGALKVSNPRRLFVIKNVGFG